MTSRALLPYLAKIVSNSGDLASRGWRNADNQPYLPVPPLLALPDWEEDEAVPYPLSREEQSALCALLPRYLARMALFAVNTGLPEQGVCWLRWGREVALPELDTAVFVIPGRPMSYPDGQWPGEKNKEDQPVVLNRVARPVIAECRGNAAEYVFDYQGRRIQRMYNTAWKTAWRKVGLGLPADAKVCRGPHKT